MGGDTSGQNSLRNIAFASLGAVALGISLFFLSRDDGENALEDGVSDTENKEPQLTDRHTFEKLKELLEMMHIELSCTYVRNYNKLLQTREKQRASIEPDKIMDYERMAREQILQNRADICEEYCLSCFPNPHKPDDKHEDKESLTADLFRQWVAIHEETEYVRGQSEAITKMHRELFIEDIGEPQLSHIDYSGELPEDLTKEAYIQMYRKIWATVRHDFYKDIIAAKKALPEDKQNEKMSQDTFADIYEKNLDNFEALRSEIYQLVMNVKLTKPMEAKMLMQKAYITFASKPNILPDGTRGLRPRWPDLIIEAATQHMKYIQAMMDGYYPPEIEVDPRQAADPASKTIYS